MPPSADVNSSRGRRGRGARDRAVEMTTSILSTALTIVISPPAMCLSHFSGCGLATVDQTVSKLLPGQVGAARMAWRDAQHPERYEYLARGMWL